MGGLSIWHWLVVLVFLGIYFVPGIVALHRRHPQRVAILVLNVFAGWTFIGWVGTLVWSVIKFEKAQSNNG